jgi:N,N'-diacetyllegionaminate synthase
MTMKNTYIIAEMACSHEGDARLARTIIDAAGRAGADAIQFQIWIASKMVVPHHPAYQTLLRLEMPQETWAELAEYTLSRYPMMHIIGCVYEHESVDFCQQIGVDAYKLHAADLANPSLVRYVAATGKRIDLSVGASTLDEIQTALQWIRDVSAAQVWLMYGYQSFPTPTDAIHLRSMLMLEHLFDVPVGYQDHTDPESEASFWLPAVALGMNISILEKHITHDRSLKGADHEAALNPVEFARFVQMVRSVERAMGRSTPRQLVPEELAYRAYARKSIVARHNLSPGTAIAEDDVLFLRADVPGLPPAEIGRLVGRHVRVPIAAFHVIREDYLACEPSES